MPIAVGCQCGQRFAAPDHLAGKQVKCPKCGSPLSIPSGNPAATAPPQPQMPAAPTAPAAAPRDFFAEAGFAANAPNMTNCPACRAPMNVQAVLCVKCGFDRRTGKQMQGVTPAFAAAGGHGGHGDGTAMLLARAAKAIDDDKAEEAKKRAEGLPAWAYAILLLGVGLLTVGIMSLGIGVALLIVGYVVQIVSAIMMLYYAIRLLGIALHESGAQLLLNLFVPFYFFYYVYTRWDQCNKFFSSYMIWWLVGILSYGVMIVGAMLALSAAEAAKQTGGG